MSKARPRSRRKSDTRRGFTLIEVMLVVAILGVLASIAIPAFNDFTLKTKRAERDLLMQGFERALLQMVAERDKFPNDLGGGVSYISTPYNPPSAPTGIKQQWSPNYGDWRFVDGQPAGMVYYRYFAYGYTSPGASYFYVGAEGDLDGNGIYSYRYRYWYNQVGFTTGWERIPAFDYDSGVAIY